jgi:hypothetical protein
MRASNFFFESGTYLVVGDLELDLHNDYDFTSLNYDVALQSIKLVWLRGQGHWVKSSLPSRVTIECICVTQFESIPGKSSLPQSESLCLGSFGYCTSEEWGQGQFWVDGAPDPEWAWSFEFQSAQEFRIRGASASVAVEA